MRCCIHIYLQVSRWRLPKQQPSFFPYPQKIILANIQKKQFSKVRGPAGHTISCSNTSVLSESYTGTWWTWLVPRLIPVHEAHLSANVARKRPRRALRRQATPRLGSRMSLCQGFWSTTWNGHMWDLTVTAWSYIYIYMFTSLFGVGSAYIYIPYIIWFEWTMANFEGNIRFKEFQDPI